MCMLKTWLVNSALRHSSTRACVVVAALVVSIDVLLESVQEVSSMQNQQKAAVYPDLELSPGV